MSTLVKLVMAIVLQITGGTFSEEIQVSSISEVREVTCQQELEQLNPHYIITRDELVSRTN